MKFSSVLSIALAVLTYGVQATRKTTTPAGCKKLNTDTDWPSPEAWHSALPGVIPSPNKTDRWGPLPDYRLQAKSIEDVQAAVRFAKEHNIRLTILTTGHDQLGRSDAGSGLLIDLSLFQGARVMQSYTPTTEGLPFVGMNTTVHKIEPVECRQAAVSYGPAVAGSPLNYRLAESGLFTVSGAAGMCSLLHVTSSMLIGHSNCSSSRWLGSKRRLRPHDISIRPRRRSMARSTHRDSRRRTTCRQRGHKQGSLLGHPQRRRWHIRRRGTSYM